jgi:hypothetical protein
MGVPGFSRRRCRASSCVPTGINQELRFRGTDGAIIRLGIPDFRRFSPNPFPPRTGAPVPGGGFTQELRKNRKRPPRNPSASSGRRPTATGAARDPRAGRVGRAGRAHPLPRRARSSVSTARQNEDRLPARPPAIAGASWARSRPAGRRPLHQPGDAVRYSSLTREGEGRGGGGRAPRSRSSPIRRPTIHHPSPPPHGGGDQTISSGSCLSAARFRLQSHAAPPSSPGPRTRSDSGPGRGLVKRHYRVRQGG